MKRSLLALIGKDLHEAWNDGRIWRVWALALSALFLAAWHGGVSLQKTEAERATVSTAVRAQWEAQGEKNPHSAAHFGQYVFQPAGAPTLIDPGVGAQTGRAIWLDPHRRNLARFKASEDHTPAHRLAQGGLAWVLQWVLPLLVVLMSFGALAAERESGTWRMLASLGVTPARLFTGKIAGLGVVLLPTWVFFTLALGLAAGQDAPHGPDSLVRIAGLALLYTVYLLIFGCIALGVSARTASASRALAVLLVLWGVNGFIAPRAGAAIAQAAIDLPTSEQFHAAIQHDLAHGMGQDGDAPTRNQQFLAATLAKYGVNRAEDLPVGLRGLRLIANDAYASRVHEKHFQDLEDRFIAQADWQLVATLAGPLMPVRALSQALAGTDIRHHVHFATAAEAYRRSFIDATSERIAQSNTGTDNTATADNAFWSSLAPFDYQPPSVFWAQGQQGWALALLGAWLICAFWFAVSGMQRLTREA